MEGPADPDAAAIFIAFFKKNKKEAILDIFLSTLFFRLDMHFG